MNITTAIVLPFRDETIQWPELGANPEGGYDWDLPLIIDWTEDDDDVRLGNIQLETDDTGLRAEYDMETIERIYSVLKNPPLGYWARWEKQLEIYKEDV
jgi:hypothetical protein